MYVKLEDKMASARAKIIGAVLHYQNNHRGLSPTDEMIAIESGLTREIVRGQLREMERLGWISDSKRWPRIIKVNRDLAIDGLLDQIDPRQKPLATAPVSQVVRKEKEMETVKKSEKAPPTHWGRGGFERAKLIAHIIDEYTDLNGMPPTGMYIRKKIAEAAGVHDKIPYSSVLSEAASMMVKEGWLKHDRKKHADWRLTNLGRTTLLRSSPITSDAIAATEMVDTVTVAEKAPVRAVQPRTAPVGDIGNTKVVIRGLVPEAAPAQTERSAPIRDLQTVPDLSDVDSLDMALELQRRGWRVTR